MRFASGLSRLPGLDAAVAEACAALRAGLGADPDLIVGFVAGHALGEAPLSLSRRFPGAEILGCAASGVVEGGRALEEGPAVSLLGALLPDVGIRSFHLGGSAAAALSSPARWHADIGVEPESQPAFLLFADPFTADVPALLRPLDAAWPGSVKVGALSSAGGSPADHRLFSGGEAWLGGIVGVALWGDVEVEAVTAQGCRPVGAPVTVTACDGPWIRELDDRPAVDVLEQLLLGLSSADQQRFARAPHIGLLDPPEGGAAGARTFGAGRYLIRSFTGIERDSGSFSVAASVRPGQRVCLHVRDARYAEEEARRLLLAAMPSPGQGAWRGALAFPCAGRGSGFFGTADKDAGMLQATFRGIPAAGLFAGGEIGPIGGRTFLHTYTAVTALFRPRGWD